MDFDHGTKLLIEAFDHGTKLNRINVLGRNIPSAVVGLGTMLW